MIRVPNSVPRSTRIAAINAAAAVAKDDPVVHRWAMLVRTNAVIWQISVPEAALRIVQSLGYTDAEGDGDWYQSFGETVQHGGDCKALSALLVGLLLVLGYRAHAMWIEEGSEPLDHIAVLVQLRPGEPYVWAEPSVKGAILGESPFDAARRLGVNVTTTDRERKRQLLRTIDT